MKKMMVLFGLAAVSVMAETILPVGYTSNSEFAVGWGARTIHPGVLIGVTKSAADTVDASKHGGSGWVSKENAVNPHIQYDLGGPYDLTALKIYNGALAGQYNRGVQQLDIQVSTDGVNWKDAAKDQRLNQTTGTGVEWQTVNFSASNCRYVRLTVDSNYGNTYTEIAKVQFQGTGIAGQTIVIPSSASTTMGAFGDQTIRKTIDQSGICTPSDMMNSTADDAPTSNWISQAGNTTGEIIYSFDQAQNLLSMLVWNGNDGANAFRGVNQFDLYVSPDAAGENWTAVVTDGSLAITSNSGNWLGPQAVPIRWKQVHRVKMVVNANHGNKDYTMLLEVAFVSIP